MPFYYRYDCIVICRVWCELFEKQMKYYTLFKVMGWEFASLQVLLFICLYTYSQFKKQSLQLMTSVFYFLISNIQFLYFLTFYYCFNFQYLKVVILEFWFHQRLPRPSCLSSRTIYISNSWLDRFLSHPSSLSLTPLSLSPLHSSIPFMLHLNSIKVNKFYFSESNIVQIDKHVLYSLT